MRSTIKLSTRVFLIKEEDGEHFKYDVYKDGIIVTRFKLNHDEDDKENLRKIVGMFVGAGVGLLD